MAGRGRARGRGLLAAMKTQPPPVPGQKGPAAPTTDALPSPGRKDTTPNFEAKTPPSSDMALLNGSEKALQNDVQKLNISDTVTSPGSGGGDDKLPKNLAPLVAKYSYTAVPNSPLKAAELSVKQKEELKFIAVHELHAEWWLVSNEQGQEGYVPSSYMLVMQVTALPWLAGRDPEGLDEVTDATKAAYKPYKPSFSHKSLGIVLDGDEEARPKDHWNVDTGKPAAKPTSWRCELCQKNFNGPQPYSAHMHSKGHKEELEDAKADGWLHEVKGYENWKEQGL